MLRLLSVAHALHGQLDSLGERAAFFIWRGPCIGNITIMNRAAVIEQQWRCSLDHSIFRTVVDGHRLAIVFGHLPR
jgi:hypothetical protein